VTVPRWACPRRASGESGRERAVASMVAHSEVVMATGVAVMMGAVIAATAAVIGWRLGGGGGLIRPRVASTISAVRRSERLAKAGSNMLISAVPPFGRLSGTRCWPALGLQTRALKRPISAAEASTGHLSLHGHVERPCLARPTAWSTAQRRSDRLRLTNDEKPSRSRRRRLASCVCRGGGSR